MEFLFLQCAPDFRQIFGLIFIVQFLLLAGLALLLQFFDLRLKYEAWADQMPAKFFKDGALLHWRELQKALAQSPLVLIALLMQFHGVNFTCEAV